MRITYVHGLDSSSKSIKGQLIEEYCQTHYPDVDVICPDLNISPDSVFEQLCKLVKKGVRGNEQTVLLGSSLGGFFAALVSNATGCPAVLLNPSTQPHISLQRFLDTEPTNINNINDNTVVYKTAGGWKITFADLHWFNNHQLDVIKYPERLYVLIKAADEVLDARIATDFYRIQGAEVVSQEGGDHRMTDFEQQLPMIMRHLERFMS